MSRRRQPEIPSADLRYKLQHLPDAPGVYLHKDKQGRVIYVGKAKRLTQRVRSYFQSGSERDPKTDQLVKQIRDFDFIATTTETEALVLESQLIKEYRPHFNIQLRDDKQYPYIKITLAEPFPRVMVVRRIAGDRARYFGPYTNVKDMRETLKFASGLFQIRTCHLDLPDQTVPRPCLDYQIGRCSAPCVGYDAPASYRQKVRQLVLFLDGSDQKIAKQLQAAMAALAQNLRYEEAAQVRDRLRKLERTVSRSRSVAGLSANLDACAVARDGSEACGVILRVRRGRILTAHHFHFRDRLEQRIEEIQAHLLREFYPRAGDIPAEVLLSHQVDDATSWRTWLGQLRGKRVRLHRPRRGAKKEAVEMARTNAAFKLGEHQLDADVRTGRKVTPADIALQEALGLHSVPETIECFDISNFQGREAVGSLVYFRGEAPQKSRYRRFRIKTVAGIDDCAMMSEILDRYYGRLAAKDHPPADLVMIDGGAGQLAAARAVLTSYGFHATQLIGLAKREEVVYREQGLPPLRLSRSSPALRLLQRIRDEAHRFAITYHRLLRDQRTTASILDKIPGIGRTKKLSLLHHFGTVSAIRKATGPELGRVRGLNRRDVASILTFFANEGE